MAAISRHRRKAVQTGDGEARLSHASQFSQLQAWGSPGLLRVAEDGRAKPAHLAFLGLLGQLLRARCRVLTGVTFAGRCAKLLGKIRVF